MRLSLKNSAMPPSAATIVNQSARVAGSPRNHAPSSATQIGAVYWSRMALAAVVRVVAVQKLIVHTVYPIAPRIWSREK